MSDYFDVKSKVKSGKEWRDHVNVPVGDDDTMELSYGLIPEEDLLASIYPSLDLQTIQEYQEEDQSEWEDRLYELQSQDDLSDEEEAELNDLHEKLESHKMELVDALGKDTFLAIMKAGKVAVKPDDDDISEVLTMGTTEQERHFGRAVKTREQAEDALTADMKDTLTKNPYPIKFTLGQQALNESGTVGNGNE